MFTESSATGEVNFANSDVSDSYYEVDVEIHPYMKNAAEMDKISN